MAVTTTQTPDQRMDEMIKEYEGKNVYVVTHLISHISEPSEMLCVDQINDSTINRYLFVSSLEEKLDGRLVLHGLYGWGDSHTKREGQILGSILNENGEWKDINPDVPCFLAGDYHSYPSISLSYLEEDIYQKAIELWRKREK